MVVANGLRRDDCAVEEEAGLWSTIENAVQGAGPT